MLVCLWWTVAELFFDMAQPQIQVYSKTDGHFPFDGHKYKLGVDLSLDCTVPQCHWPPEQDNE